MLHLCLTFDYELFFAHTDFSEQDVLFKPTERILDLLDEYDMKATFYADTASCIRYAEFGLNDFPKSFNAQITSMRKRKHDIQLHIHPIWYNAKLEKGKWQFDNRYYRLHAFDKIHSEVDMRQIFLETKNYLESVLKEVDNNYKCVSFRAGGFCIQPEQEIFKLMEENRIIIDSSVCKGLYSNTGTHYYNFTKTPEKENWWMSSESGLCREDCNGKIFEIPIGSICKKPEKWLIVHKNPRLRREELKGKTSDAIEMSAFSCKKLLQKINDFWNHSVMMSLDSAHYKALIEMVYYYLKTYDCVNQEIYICLIGHPKLFGITNLENLKNFIEQINNQFSDAVIFNTIEQAYQENRK